MGYSLCLASVYQSDIQLLYEWLAANISHKHWAWQWQYTPYGLPNDLCIYFDNYQALIAFKLRWSDEYP
jgi:hypothetical protein